MWAWGLVGCVIYVDTWDGRGDSGEDTVVPGGPSAYPAVGDAVLQDRATYGYEAATLSIEFGGGAPYPGNDWDLLFGNDDQPGMDTFAVNMVTDDRSFIVDLGALDHATDAPETVDPAEHPVGMFGEADYIPVLVGHSYLVRTVDTESRLYSLVRVIAHHRNEDVVLRWCRSGDPERFVAPWGCDPG